MNNIDTSSLISKLKVLEARINQGIQAPGIKTEESTGKNNQFGEILTNAIKNVSETQNQAKELSEMYEKNPEQMDVAQVMIAMQKSSIAFESVLQVRNRLVSAYQEIMNMPI